MWTITDEQLRNISNTMRSEFEKRAYFVLSKEDCTKELSDDFVKQNIHTQMERVIKYNIKNEELAIQFIRLSFEYPVLQNETWDEFIEQKLLGNENDENKKLEVLTDYLSIN